MDPRLRKKHAQIMAELHLLGVPVPLSLEPGYSCKAHTGFTFKVSHRSGKIETGEIDGNPLKVTLCPPAVS
jgi:hypothetical protein